MGQYQDKLPSQLGWIHELAKAEIHPDAEKLLQLGKSFDPHQLVEESTVDFLTELREYFGEHARVFNNYSDKGSRFQEVKIYSLAQTPADFMIFRNQVKLLVSNTAHGLIQVNFAKHQSHPGGSIEMDASEAANNPHIAKAQEIMAQVGPFREVFWTFQGEKVQASQLARFYFAEFVRASRKTDRNKQSNQILLNQIKSLLEEKGMEF